MNNALITLCIINIIYTAVVHAPFQFFVFVNLDLPWHHDGQDLWFIDVWFFALKVITPKRIKARKTERHIAGVYVVIIYDDSSCLPFNSMLQYLVLWIPQPVLTIFYFKSRRHEIWPTHTQTIHITNYMNEWICEEMILRFDDLDHWLFFWTTPPTALKSTSVIYWRIIILTRITTI